MEKLAKLVLLTSTMVGYSYLTEFFMAWYGPSKADRDLFWFRATGHYWWAFWTMFSCNVIFPLLLCILPVLFIVVIGPAAMDIAKVFSRM